MNALCVFCGSSPGVSPAYAEAAAALGHLLAEQRIDLVYGGGKVGMMGVLADACLAHGGRVMGVIPAHLWNREVGHAGVTEMHVVASMHERKARMAELADGFMALPGGIGTMEEFFEVWTWGQLGLHAKPYGLLDAGGYFDPLIRFLDHMVEEGFLGAAEREHVLVDQDPARLLDRLSLVQPRPAQRWIGRDDT
ncbi:MAG TPA: TIGR00730 family Rossman fold protein [Longimicrobiales bacterium]